MNVSNGKIRMGTRDSTLALIQARLAAEAILRICPHLDIEIVPMKTTGDRILDVTLEAIGGKGLFVKELDDALAEGKIDISVHSYKDLPSPGPSDLPVIAVLPRDDPRDVLVLPEGTEEPDLLLPLGTSSARRRAELAVLFPEWPCQPVRGNVQTRFRKMASGAFGGLVLAAAGLRRLDLEQRIHRAFSVEEMVPAPCQGIIAVQGRADRDYSFLSGVNDPDTWTAAQAERSFVLALGAGCSDPVGAYATVAGGQITLTGLRVDRQGTLRKGTLSGPAAEAEAIGQRLAKHLTTGDGENG